MVEKRELTSLTIQLCRMNMCPFQFLLLVNQSSFDVSIQYHLSPYELVLFYELSHCTLGQGALQGFVQVKRVTAHL